jgi:hypothetical protein
MHKREDLVSHLPDADMQAAPKALLRAAQRARELAERTGTQLVVCDEPDGKPSLSDRDE